MIKRNRSAVLSKRDDSDEEHDLFADHEDTMENAVVALEEDESPRRRAWTRWQFALAALSATPVLFIGGLGGWPWDNEPAVANNNSNVVAGHEQYPATVSLARLGINTSLTALTTNAAGVMKVPGLGQAGWVESGPEPGELGRAVILGRRAQSGDDAFAQLAKAKAGDKIVVTTVTGKTLTFVVSSVEQFKTDAVPESRVYGGGKKQAQLRIISSTGTYNQAKGGFPRNVVVFADLAK